MLIPVISTTGVTSRKLFNEPHCPQRDNSTPCSTGLLRRINGIMCSHHLAQTLPSVVVIIGACGRRDQGPLPAFPPRVPVHRV